MRFIDKITPAKLEKLEFLYNKGSDYRERKRAHSIILSMKGFRVDQISNILDVDQIQYPAGDLIFIPA